jgi:hypothetical protein
MTRYIYCDVQKNIILLLGREKINTLYLKHVENRLRGILVWFFFEIFTLLLHLYPLPPPHTHIPILFIFYSFPFLIALFLFFFSFGGGGGGA